MESSSLLSPESSPNLAAPGDSELDSLPSPTGAKTLALLDLLSQHPEGLTATEAVRESGFTHNLVFRILKTLVAMGFALQREDNKAYTLSNRILDLTSPRNGGSQSRILLTGITSQTSRQNWRNGPTADRSWRKRAHSGAISRNAILAGLRRSGNASPPLFLRSRKGDSCRLE